MRDKRDKRTNKHGSEIVRRRRREMRVEDRQHVYEGMPDNTHHDSQSVHQLAHHSITALGLPPRSPSVADSSLLAAGVLPVAPQDPQLHPSQPPFCVRIESGWGRRDGPRRAGGGGGLARALEIGFGRADGGGACESTAWYWRNRTLFSSSALFQTCSPSFAPPVLGP